MDWNEVFEEQADNNRRSTDSVDPKNAQRRFQEQHELAVRMGWSDEEGNSLLPDDDDDDDDEESDLHA